MRVVAGASTSAPSAPGRFPACTASTKSVPLLASPSAAEYGAEMTSKPSSTGSPMWSLGARMFEMSAATVVSVSGSITSVALCAISPGMVRIDSRSPMAPWMVMFDRSLVSKPSNTRPTRAAATVPSAPPTLPSVRSANACCSAAGKAASPSAKSRPAFSTDVATVPR